VDGCSSRRLEEKDRRPRASSRRGQWGHHDVSENLSNQRAGQPGRRHQAAGRPDRYLGRVYQIAVKQLYLTLATTVRPMVRFDWTQ
jgi:hypothetical protein